MSHIPEQFWTSEALLGLISTLPGAPKKLGLNTNSLFLAEKTALKSWYENLDRTPKQHTLEKYCAEYGENGEIILTIIYDRDENGEVSIVYTPADHPGTYELQIIIGDNLHYYRTPGQNEKTEWIINGMANDITDENGEIVFEGDPYNE